MKLGMNLYLNRFSARGCELLASKGILLPFLVHTIDFRKVSHSSRMQLENTVLVDNYVSSDTLHLALGLTMILKPTGLKLNQPSCFS